MTDARIHADAWMGAALRLLLRIALIVGVVAGSAYVLGRLRSLIVTLFVATILAYIMRPIAGWMARSAGFGIIHDLLWRAVIAAVPRRRRPASTIPMRGRRVIATLYVLVLLVVGGWYSGRFLISPFTAEIQNVQDNWEEYREKIVKMERLAVEWYRSNVKPTYRRWLEQQFRGTSGGNGVQGSAASWLGFGIQRTGEIALHIVEIVLLPVLAFYFAIESRQLKREFVGMLPRRRWREVLRMIHEFNEIMFSFVVCQAILCLIAGLVVGIGLGLIGMPYPVTLGILAGLTRAIPIIGPIIGGIPIVLLAWVTKGSGVAIAVLTLFSILHFVECKLIIVVLLIGQEFAGLLGMFFAAPVAALMRVVFRRYWLGVRSRERAASPH